MAKATIIIEDMGEFMSVSLDLDPPLEDGDVTTTPAQAFAVTLMNEFMEKANAQGVPQPMQGPKTKQ